MAVKTETAKAQVLIDGKEAAYELEVLKKKTKELKAEMDKAFKSGDKDLWKKLKGDSDELDKSIKKVKAATVDVTAVLKNLNGTNLKTLNAAQKQITTELSSMTRGTKEYIAASANLQKVEAEISKVKTEMHGTTSTAEKFGLSFKQAFAAFTVGGLVAQGISSLISGIKSFVSESSTKFQEAESISKKLEFAVTSVGNEGAAAFEKLNRQAEKLKGYFDDEDIRSAQTDLINYGLTAEEVYTLMPKLIDAAAQSGRELTDVSDAVIRGIEGQGRGLKTLGIELTKGASETQNLADINKQLEKFAGGATDALKTQTGQLREQEIALEDAQEKLGKYTSKWELFWTQTKANLAKAFTGLISDSEDKDAEAMSATLEKVSNRLAEIRLTAEDAGMSINDFSKNLVKGATTDYQNAINKLSHFKIALAGTDIEANEKYRELSNNVLYFQKVMQGLIKMQYETATATENTIEKDTEEKESKEKEKDAYEKLTESISEYEKLITSLNTVGEPEKAAAAAVTLQGLKDQKKAIDDLTASQQAYAAEKAKEEKDISKIAANTPNTQLEQKKADLVDYSQFEIDQAAKVADAKTAINTEYQEKQDALREKANQLIEQAEKELISTVADLWKTSLDKKLDNETHALDVAKENELANKKLTDAQKEAIEQKYAAQNLKLRQQKAKDEKLINIGKIGADTALAIMKTIAELGGVGALTPAGIALIAAMTAMGLEQAAVVAAQPIPQYATGKYPVIGASDGKRYNASVSSDTSTRLLTQPTILAGEQMPEWIIDGPTTKKMMDYPGLVSAIYSLSGRVPQYAAGKYPAQTNATNAPIISSDPNMLLLLKEISEKLDNPTRAKVVLSDLEKVQEKVQDTRNRYNL